MVGDGVGDLSVAEVLMVGVVLLVVVVVFLVVLLFVLFDGDGFGLCFVVLVVTLVP